jgi:hypothetical protein
VSFDWHQAGDLLRVEIALLGPRERLRVLPGNTAIEVSATETAGIDVHDPQVTKAVSVSARFFLAKESKRPSAKSVRHSLTGRAILPYRHGG